MTDTAGRTWDLAVIGGGPAGLAAAATAARCGIAAVLLDEQETPGGQIYRAVTETPAPGRTALGPEYRRGAALVGDLRRSGVDHLPGTQVWSVSPALEVGISRHGAARILPVRHVILATGAIERPFPVPGWTLPGVMTAGAAQILLKSSGLVAAGRVVLAGSGPLLWLLAWQYLRAGADIDAILDTTPRANRRDAAVHLPDFLRSPYLGKGLRLLLDVRRKIRVVMGVSELRAEGETRVETVAFRRADGPWQHLRADTLLLHQGVVPNPNLAASIGCALEWDPLQLCWKPVTDAWGATGIDGVSVAGDGAGIAGAVAAEHRGRLAALDAARRLGRIDAGERDRAARPHRRALDRAMAGRRFLDTLYRPSEAMRIPRGDTVVCRCEEITADQVIDAVKLGCTGPNQLKTFLRCGMGPCQGRLCGPTVTELIARSRGVRPDDVGYYRLRPPVKPITLGELASLPKTGTDIDAVSGS